MKLQMVGCSHHNASLEVRERLAFSPDQTAAALGQWRKSFPTTEAVLLSTCNRVEFYTAADDPAAVPSDQQVKQFLGRVSRPAIASGVRRFIRTIGRRGGAAFVYRGGQLGQHGAGRAANSVPGEAGLSIGRTSRKASDRSRMMFFSGPCGWPNAWRRKLRSTKNA